MSKLIQLSFVDFEIRLVLVSPFCVRSRPPKRILFLLFNAEKSLCKLFLYRYNSDFSKFLFVLQTFQFIPKIFSLPNPMMAQSSGYFSTARTKMNFQNEFCEKFTMRMRNANAQTHTPARERKSVEQMRVWARESHTPTHCNELYKLSVVERKNQWLNILVCILVASCINHVFIGASYCKSTHNGIYLLCAFWQPNITVYSIYYDNSGETAKHLANVVKL